MLLIPARDGVPPVVYTHIPKTGGTWFVETTKVKLGAQRVGQRHEPLWHFLERFPDEAHRTRVTCLRSPEPWYWSWYCYAIPLKLQRHAYFEPYVAAALRAEKEGRLDPDGGPEVSRFRPRVFGPVTFRRVLYGATHLSEVDPADFVPTERMPVWEPLVITRWSLYGEQAKPATGGLWSWTYRFMLGDSRVDHFFRADEELAPQVESFFLRRLGEPYHKRRNATKGRRNPIDVDLLPKPGQPVFDDEMQGWVRDADEAFRLSAG